MKAQKIHLEKKEAKKFIKIYLKNRSVGLN